MGFLPRRDEFHRYIEHSEKVLKKDCRTVLEFEAASRANNILMFSPSLPLLFTSHLNPHPIIPPPSLLARSSRKRS